MPIRIDMRAFWGRYEVEIRLGLVAIVVLLLFLNFNTAYILHSIKNSLVTDIDNRLESGLDYTLQYIRKNNLTSIDGDHLAAVKSRYGVELVGLFPVSNATSLTIPVSGEKVGLKLEKDEIESLLDGRNLFYSQDGSANRYAMKAAVLPEMGKALIICRTDSHRIDTIAGAGRRVLYLAMAVLVLIIPLVIGLPRLILRPFQTLRLQAQSAGKLSSTKGGDEVAEVIRSYEGIIEELKRHEQELERLYRESSHKANRLESINDYILKSIGSGVIVVDLTGRILGFNRAAADILGYEERFVLDQNYLVAFPEDMELCLLIAAGLERGEVCTHREFHSHRPDGAEKWLGAESAIIYNDRDSVIGVTLLISDMTELKKLYSELEVNRQMAALGEMTGGLAHQLRNSLAAISGFCQLMQKKTQNDDGLNDIAGSIRIEAASSEEMVSRFLTFARPLSLCKEVIDVKEVLDECRTKIEPDAAVRDISIEIDYPADDVTVDGDFLLLKEAISNVLANAVQASSPGDRVDILLSVNKEHVVIVIRDRGAGIAPSIKDKLFTPFVSSKPSGTGLGLALTRKIINLHSGAITLEPGSPQGTECRIGLPLEAVGQTVPNRAALNSCSKNSSG